MDQYKIVSLANGVEGGFIRSDKFKSSILSIDFYLPNSEQTADYVLAGEIMSNVCAEYPTMASFKRRLSELYGAALNTSAEKAGDMIRLGFSIEFINDDYALNGDKIGADAAKLLISVLFEPSLTDDGKFRTADIERDKRVMIDVINGEFNEKRNFARKRTLEIMCENEPFGLPKFGTVERMSSLTADDVTTAWQSMLKDSFVRVNYVGNEYPSEIFDLISKRFQAIDRTVIKQDLTQKHISSGEVKSVCEYETLNQSKLFLGFRADFGNDMLSRTKMLLTLLIFSGGTFSKCFRYVREQLSLCYYCAPSFYRSKNIIMVDCGVDIGASEKAKNAILDQLRLMKNGEITNDEFEAAVLMRKNDLKAVFDSVVMISSWLKSNTFNDEKYNSIEEHYKILEQITIDDIVNAAKTIELDTVYLLEGKKEAE